MAKDYVVNDVCDPSSRYKNVLGVPSRRLIICAVVLIVFVFILIGISFSIMSKQDDINKSGRQAFAHFQDSVNTSVDPCTDFYSFSCGLWAENNPASDFKPRVTKFNLLQQIVNEKERKIFDEATVDDALPRVVNNALRFYNTCSEQRESGDSGIQVVLEYFDQIGGWPILNKYKWNESAFNWLDYSAFLIKHADLHTAIGVYAMENAVDGGRDVIFFTAPRKLQELTLDNIATVNMLYVILQFLNGSGELDELYIAEEISNLRTVESKWNELLSVANEVSEFSFMSLKELIEEVPDIDWLRYLQLITNDTLQEVNSTLTVNDTVVFDNLEFLRRVAYVLSSDTFSKLELANLFGWFVVRELFPLMPGVIQSYDKLTYLYPEGTEGIIKDKCFELTFELFPCSVNYLYVKNSSKSEIPKIKTMINYLRSSFQDIIKDSHWLDDETVSSILARLNNMNYIIGFPFYMNNKTEFDKMYEDVPIINDASLKYYFIVKQWYVRRRILSLRVPAGGLERVIPRSVTDVSAYYAVHKNTLVYPISLHNPPFYHFKGPWFLNFGSIGSSIGHEMMHGVDNIRNKEQNLGCFSNASRILFQERANCFKRQYSLYDSSCQCKNNGTRTLRENVADNEGLRIAFRAYQNYVKDVGDGSKYRLFNNYSPDQMFFIAYGTMWCSTMTPLWRQIMANSTHSFPEVRVNNAVSNSHAFALAFNCPEGSPMNPVKKCSIW